MFRTAIAAALAAASLIAAPAFTERKSLTLDGAKRVIAAAVEQARRSNAHGVVAVVDAGGNLMALERIDGTFSAGAKVSIGKARTAALFQKPTRFFEEIINKGRTAMAALDDFTPLQGGIPLMLDGDLVGGVGVSGANSAMQDEELALAGAAALANNASPQVTFFDNSAVKDAFAKGAVLFDHGERYMVHASKREAAGMAEIHNDDTDIVYVLDGTATLVTGGRAENLKTTAPGELRGSAISGGDERQLSPGDVVIIPAGVPHWFKQVSAPFHYYVVKSR